MSGHQVYAGEFLGDGVLDLETRVGLDEVEGVRVVRVDEELEGPEAEIPGRRSHRDRGLDQQVTRARGEPRAGRDLDQLLVAALDRALPVPQVGHLAGAVPDDLDLDVLGAGQQLLDVDVAVAEGALGLGAAALVGPGEVRRVVHGAHAAAASPATAFTMTPSRTPARNSEACASEVGAPVAARTGTPCRTASARELALSPKRARSSGVGPTKVSPASAHAFAKSAFSLRNP